MTKRLQVYETPEIVVTFDPNVCVHSAVCVTRLPGVFDVRRQRWIDPEAADATDVAATIQKCPSKALQFYRNVSRNPNAKASLTRAILMNRLAILLGEDGDRPARALKLAGAIRSAGPYRSVGFYDVTPAQVTLLCWSGDGAGPAHPSFDPGEGLTGAALRARETVVVGDVQTDPRCLAAHADTRSEMIVPVLDPATREVVGTVDIESERADAFGTDDRALAEDSARAIAPLWTEGA
jgi:putative methionine-R-sulfoxide reductase with GAF domain/uncharacterized Fe-S cluster protein YjdI